LTRGERRCIVVGDGLKHDSRPGMRPGEVRIGSVVIDGLKLTMTGGQLRYNLDERIRWHQHQIDRMTTESRTTECSLADGGAPDSVRAAEIRHAERRINALSFIRDYIVADEVYRLGEFDLRFADLLPDEDDWDDEAFGIPRVTPPLRA